MISFGEFYDCIDCFTKAQKIDVRKLVKLDNWRDAQPPFADIKRMLWATQHALEEGHGQGNLGRVMFYRRVFQDPSPEWMKAEITPILQTYVADILVYSRTLSTKDDNMTAHYLQGETNGDWSHNGLMSFIRMWNVVQDRPHPRAIDDCAKKILAKISGYLKNNNLEIGDVAGIASGETVRQITDSYWNTGHHLFVCTVGGFPEDVKTQMFEGRFRE